MFAGIVLVVVLLATFHNNKKKKNNNPHEKDIIAILTGLSIFSWQSLKTQTSTYCAVQQQYQRLSFTN